MVLSMTSEAILVPFAIASKSISELRLVKQYMTEIVCELTREYLK